MSNLQKKKVTSRQAQALETRNKIYNVALDLMEKKGFDNITIHDIIEKADISIGGFYHYFKSKNDILFEIYQRADNYFRKNVAGKLKSGNSLDQIVEFFQYYAKYHEISDITFTKHLYSTENKYFTQKGRFLQIMLQEIIAAGQKNGEIILEMSPEQIEDYLFIAARGVVFNWCLYNGEYSLEESMIDYIKKLVVIFKK